MDDRDTVQIVHFEDVAEPAVDECRRRMPFARPEDEAGSGRLHPAVSDEDPSGFRRRADQRATEPVQNMEGRSFPRRAVDRTGGKSGEVVGEATRHDASMKFVPTLSTKGEPNFTLSQSMW